MLRVQSPIAKLWEIDYELIASKTHFTAVILNGVKDLLP